MRGAQSDKGCFMAKIFENGRWKKRTLTALSVALATSLSLGIFSACDAGDDEDDDDTVAAQTDTQLIKNGNFEFYGDKPLAAEKRKNFINSPDSWTNSRGSDSLGTAPSSDTKSGIVDAKEWETLSVSKLGENKFSSIADAMARWEQGSIYDRLKFYDEFEDELDDQDSKSEEKEFFAKYNYSIDFEDVEKLNEEIGTLSTRYGANDEAKDDNTNVLMIHNQKKTDSVWGTAQYYTSGTTVTLEAGTSAKVSVWVKTASLKHWYEGVEAKTLGGAYIGVTHTVGGTTLDQMQIKNINTKDVESDNGWEQYTLYVRASTFATSTFRIVLGLGMGSTGNMDETVDGYAFFDDLTCEIIPNSEYLESTDALAAEYSCGADTRDAEKKKFNAAKLDGRTFALDLFAEGATDLAVSAANVEIDLTKETSGSVTYDPTHADPSLTDDKTKNYTALATLDQIKTAANSNAVLKKIVESDDFKTDAYPLNRGGNVLMLMSANGTAYTAKLSYNAETDKTFTLAPQENLLLSFFVKTSKIASGLTGAGVTLVDGDNRTSISPFDSTTVKTIDIDDEQKDINNGWVQCFFFVSNETEEEKSFSLEFTYGPTSITGNDKHAFGDGYAAFTGFETRKLTKHEYSYASTGDRAQKVSLSASSSSTNRFDSVAATGKTDLETTLALPANYRGVLGGGKFVTGEGDDAKPANVYSGLLNTDYAQAYLDSANNNGAWTGVFGSSATGEAWWNEVFGNAVQPLVIVNGAATEGNTVPSYGYYAETATVTASSYQRISMRVKASVGAKAYLYLTDTSDVKKGYDNRLVPNMPLVTYWYDDEGNICASDPQDKEYDEKTGLLYNLEPNGLYTKEGGDGTYFANLYNYDKDDNGNLVTNDGTIAFYAHDGKIFAYYNEDTETYSTEVKCLPKTEGETQITRYDFTEQTMPEAYMVVEGTGDWVDVSFYLHAGNTDKSYRLEVWSGSRAGDVKNPENSYVIFDNYASADVSSDYSALLEESVKAMRDAQNKGEDENLEENALYYTFTFYDARSYLRYDKTEDKDELGNPWENYKQSGYSEQLVYLFHADVDGVLTGAPAYSMFLDYGATDVTVERANQNTGDDDGNDEEDDAAPEFNVWLLIASGSLSAVLLFAIVMVLVRMFRKKHPSVSVKRVKQKKEKKAKAEKAPEPEKEEEQKPAPERDEDDPYNE